MPSLVDGDGCDTDIPCSKAREGAGAPPVQICGSSVDERQEQVTITGENSGESNVRVTIIQ